MSVRQYFGTDGVRGKVGGSVVNPEMMHKLGYAIGVTLQADALTKPCVLIGRDTRLSGELLQASLQKGLLAAGVDVVLLGVLSTPAIAYFTQHFHATAGIIISASHNPYYDNGVKIVNTDGRKLSDAMELKIEAQMAIALDAIPDVIAGTVTEINDAAAQYVAHCYALFPTLSLKPYTIILDCANGATYNTAQEIFSHFGAAVTLIHATPDGLNINERCGATHLESLQQAVLQQQADCGIAFDGDGDRLMMVDHAGVVVDGDEILAMLAADDTQQYDAVVGTLMSNLGLEQSIKARGMEFVRVAVGDRYVLEKLQEKNWVLGGEKIEGKG